MSADLFTHSPPTPRPWFQQQIATRWHQVSECAKQHPAEASAVMSFVVGIVLSGTLVQGVACGAVAFLASKISALVRERMPHSFPFEQISTVLVTCSIIRLFIVLPLTALGVHLHVHMLWTAISNLAFQLVTHFFSGRSDHNIFPLIL